MIKYIFLFLLSVCCSSIYAQNFTVSPNPNYVEADLDINPGTVEIFTQTSIVNNTSDTLFLKWERTIINKPECWETSVWSIDIQALPITDTKEFLLMPNSASDELNVHAHIDGLGAGSPSSGEAEIVLKVSNLNNSTDTLSVHYNFSVTGGADCTTSTFDIESETLNIFPNPATDYFQLTEGQDAHYIVVYNLLGQQIKQFDFSQTQNYSINNLPDGIYILKVVDRQRRIINTTKLQKH